MRFRTFRSHRRLRRFRWRFSLLGAFCNNSNSFWSPVETQACFSTLLGKWSEFLLSCFICLVQMTLVGKKQRTVGMNRLAWDADLCFRSQDQEWCAELSLPMSPGSSMSTAVEIYSARSCLVRLRQRFMSWVKRIKSIFSISKDINFLESSE